MRPQSRHTAVESEESVDRLRELTSIGAGHAATALARLVGRTIWMKVPSVQALAARRSPEPGGATGVFFDVDGGPGGLLAVLFPDDVREALLRRLAGGADPADLDAESAVREVANILASSLLSAIADTLGERILPSMPSAVLSDAGAQLEARLARHRGDGLCIEAEIFERGGELRSTFVFVPEPGASAARR